MLRFFTSQRMVITTKYVLWSRQTRQLDKVRSVVIKYLLHFIICCLLSAWPKIFCLSETQRQTDLFMVFDQVPSEVYSKTEVLVESHIACVAQQKSLWRSVVVWHCPWCWTCISGSHSRSHQCRPGFGSYKRKIAYSFWGWIKVTPSITAVSADPRLALEGEASAR